MRVRVVKAFKDKHTKIVYQKGEEIEVTSERFEELTSAAPFVEAISESKEQKKPAPKKPATKKSTTKKNTKK